MAIDRDEVARLTAEYGGEWGTGHAKRLLHLIPVIGEGLTYDEEVVWLAAHLHDWGGWAKWAVAGVDHAARSVQVIEAFAKERKWPAEVTGPVLECIRHHHAGGEMRIIESVLFTDADALDLLGVVGFARIFAMSPRDLAGGRKAVVKWRDQAQAVIKTERAKEMARERIAETDALLARLEEEAFGYY